MAAKNQIKKKTGEVTKPADLTDYEIENIESFLYQFNDEYSEYIDNLIKIYYVYYDKDLTSKLLMSAVTQELIDQLPTIRGNMNQKKMDASRDDFRRDLAKTIVFLDKYIYDYIDNPEHDKVSDLINGLKENLND